MLLWKGPRVPLSDDVLVEESLGNLSAPLEHLRRVDANSDRVADLALGLAGDHRRILILGCGNGALAVKLARRSRVDVIHAVEGNDALLRLAAQLAEQWDLGFRILLNRADAASVPLPDGMFDLVVGSLTLCRASDPGRVLREAARLAAPSGAVLLVEPLRPGPVQWLKHRRELKRRPPNLRACFERVSGSGFVVPELLAMVSGAGGQRLEVRRDAGLGLLVTRARLSTRVE